MRPAPRGAALITVMVMMAILAAVVAGLLLYVNNQRLRAVAVARGTTRMSCAETGLQLARAYFARTQTCWSTFLKYPGNYNPVVTDYNPSGTAANPRASALQTSHPWLYADLDGDGNNDVYIYVRDNDDEMLPAAANWLRDNDQNVIVGAVCISSTLVPHRQDGTVDSELLSVEAILSYNVAGTTYSSQAGAGASGTGNANSASTGASTVICPTN
jgi:hypothetical protein